MLEDVWLWRGEALGDLRPDHEILISFDKSHKFAVVCGGGLISRHRSWKQAVKEQRYQDKHFSSVGPCVIVDRNGDWVEEEPEA